MPCEHCGGEHLHTPPCNPDGSRPTPGDKWSRVPDINGWRNPSFARIVPETPAGAAWCADHIYAEPEPDGAYVAEHRYAPDILLAAHNAGLVVALDGQLADAPRARPS
jgi:hypothetical protein